MGSAPQDGSGIVRGAMTSGSLTSTFLIHFSGPDRPGFTATITSVLAERNVRILDIGQAVVHENLTLGMLVEVPGGSDFTSVRSALHQRAHELGLLARFTAGSADALNHWTHGLHQHHFIITVLGRSISGEHLARISAAITAQGMNIDRIERLSGKLWSDDSSANACIELAVSGEPSHETAMRAEFLRIAQDLSIDIAFQR